MIFCGYFICCGLFIDDRQALSSEEKETVEYLW